MLNEFQLWLCRNWWTYYANADFSVERFGAKVPMFHAAGFTNLTFPESDIQEIISDSGEGTVIDVGANIGTFLLNLISVDRQRPYIGFEPNVFGSYYVHSVIRENKLTNHQVLPVGLSDVPATVTLQHNSEFDESGTIVTGFRPAKMYAHKRRIALSTGDLQLADVDHISLIKIDVEGHEPAVLRGLRRTIERHRPKVIVEMVPYQEFLDGTYDRQYYGGEISPEEIALIVGTRKQLIADVSDFFHSLGYSCAHVSPSGLVPVDHVDGLSYQRKFPNFVWNPSVDRSALNGHALAGVLSGSRG